MVNDPNIHLLTNLLTYVLTVKYVRT